VFLSFLVEGERDFGVDADAKVVVHDAALVEALEDAVVVIHERRHGGAQSVGVRQQRLADEAEPAARGAARVVGPIGRPHQWVDDWQLSICLTLVGYTS